MHRSLCEGVQMQVKLAVNSYELLVISNYAIDKVH